jgi:hypothetical protein
LAKPATQREKLDFYLVSELFLEPLSIAHHSYHRKLSDGALRAGCRNRWIGGVFGGQMTPTIFLG